jgi:BirA family biotin operon repressor/biotin-[acetyl-CoA-carboxylase] ligase
MSIVLRPKLPTEKALYITTAAAAACAEAIESVCCLKTEIKWVNDVLSEGKKVCGILTESSFDTENKLSYVVLGIGVNVFPPKDGFPSDLQNAYWLVDQPLYETRARLAAEILERFIFYYKDLSNKPFIKSYKKRLCWVGKEIDIISTDKKTPATLLGLSENLELEVQYEDGSKGLVYSGEVSIRQKNDK